MPEASAPGGAGGAPGMPPLYERMATVRGPGMPLRPGGLELTLRAVDGCGFPAGARLLDVGCGTGASVETLAAKRGFRSVGLDPSATLLRMGRGRNPGLDLVLGRGEALPFPDHSMEGLLLECVLSLAPDGARVLAEARRVLRPGGRIIVTDVHARQPGRLADLNRLAEEGCLRGALVLDDVCGRLENLGFTVDLVEDHSRELVEFAARLIFSGGFPDAFWCRAAAGEGKGADPLAAKAAIAAARPGYFLLVGTKLQGGALARFAGGTMNNPVPGRRRSLPIDPPLLNGRSGGFAVHGLSHRIAGSSPR